MMVENVVKQLELHTTDDDDDDLEYYDGRFWLTEEELFKYASPSLHASWLDSQVEYHDMDQKLLQMIEIQDLGCDYYSSLLLD